VPLWFSSLPGCGESAPGATSTLRISNWLNAAVDPEFFKLERDLEYEYEAAHPGVDMRIEPIPGVGQYAPKLLLSHAARAMPDAGYLDASSGAAFMNNGVAADLTPFIARDADFNIDDYFPNALAPFRRDGKLFAIPQDFTPMVIVYNRRMFDDAGVPYPRDAWTWTDFLDTARKLTRRSHSVGQNSVLSPGSPTPAQFGLHFENIMPFWIVWLWSAGGDVLTPDGSRASGALDSPATIDAIAFLLDLMYIERIAPTLQERAALGQDLFLTGRAAMDVKGHWMLIDYRAAGLDVGVVSIPTNIGRPTTIMYLTGLAVWQRGRQPQLGWDWVRYNTSEGVQVRRTAGGVAISANRKAAAHYATDPLETAFQRQVEYARHAWGVTVENYPVVEELGTEMMKDIAYAVPSLRRPDGTLDRPAIREMIEHNTRQTAKRIDAALNVGK
jgi:multiple sugar transport system substrate-binding protein